MKVVQLIMSFKTGGAERLLIDILNHSDLEMQSLCIVNDIYDEKLLREVNIKNKIKLIKRPEGRKNIVYLIKLFKHMYKENPDIIHCHNKASFILAIYIKKFIRKLDIIYTIHDNNIVRRDKSLVSSINKYCKKIICVSKSVEDECIENFIDKNKISVVNNAIDIEKFNLPKYKHATINIVCVARIDIEKKGQDLLIKAVKDIADKYNIVVYFAGEIASVQKKEDLYYLKKLCEQFKLKDRVEFLGNIDNIPELLRNMDILVLPSRYEGFGLAIIEAMASKTKVIASDVDGPRNIISKDSGYLFNSGDYKDLQEKIELCIKSDENMANYAFQYAMKEYSINRLCNEYKKIYMNENKS
ncbi:glycosyltransferase [Clostridium sp.]|uniref:glycosyltransferase n=1 Tax=Clostridium sp. TaxID=1506 RepID=UPI002614676B|nr:glycosyltransferase [Clostridium sp.]